MADNNNNVYYNLDYTHEELETLFDKIHDGYVLSKEQYEKLVKILDMNISEFDGDYENLTNKPMIPEFTSDLENDSHFQTAEEVNQKLVVLEEQIKDSIEAVQGPQGPEGPVGPQGPQGEDGVFNMDEVYDMLDTKDKTVIGAINELFAMIKNGVVLPEEPEQPEEPVVANKMYYGHIPYDEAMGPIEYEDIFLELVQQTEAMVEADIAVMDKTSLGVVPMGALVVIAVPEKCENFENLVATKDNGFGGKVPFDEDILGVNGLVVDFNGANYKLFGEMLLTDAELFFYIDDVK